MINDNKESLFILIKSLSKSEKRQFKLFVGRVGSNLDSKFYKNVVIKYEDKQITCENFDINMDTNIAIAYNDVVVIDPKSTMKAGKITLNLETKEIDINPDRNGESKVQINTIQ